jgi:ribonucleoside-triphosphate reductase
MEDAKVISDSVERKIFAMNAGISDGDIHVRSPLVRELVCYELFLMSQHSDIYDKYRQIYSRVGSPFYDVWNSIWKFKTFEDKENANLGGENPEFIHKKVADEVIKYSVPIGYPIGVEKANLSGDIHIHQEEYPQRPFCADYDLRWVFLNGLLADGSGIYSAAASAAMQPFTAILHAVKVMAAGQCNCQGGQGVFNFNIFVAPYLENMPYNKADAGEWEPGREPITIKQVAEMFIFEMNETYVSRGGQLVFSSIQIEPTIPAIWEDKPVVYRGKIWHDKVYGDFAREAQLFAKALLEVYLRGDRFGKMFFFPKPEVRIRKEHFKNPSEETYEIIRLAVELSSKFGSTYFDSVMPEYRNSDGQDCYQCCAYHFDEAPDTLMPKLWYEDGQHFSMSGQQVVTINLPRLAYRSKGDFSLYEELVEEQMNTAKRFLMWKRKRVLDFASRGHLPYLTQRPIDNPHHPPLYDLESGSLIFGFVGMNEFVESMTGYQLHESDVAVRTGIKAIDRMERIRRDFAEETGLNFAVARTPAESTAQHFAVKDLLKFNGEALQYVKGDKTDWKKHYSKKGRTGVPVYYTNGFMVNHSASISLDKKIDIEQKAFPLLSGGDIFNVFLGERHPDVDALMTMTERIANTAIGYWSYTIDITLCLDCWNNDVGQRVECSKCHSRNVKSFSRVTGYVQAIDGFNDGKKQELLDRYRYII